MHNSIKTEGADTQCKQNKHLGQGGVSNLLLNGEKRSTSPPPPPPPQEHLCPASPNISLYTYTASDAHLPFLLMDSWVNPLIAWVHQSGKSDEKRGVYHLLSAICGRCFLQHRLQLVTGERRTPKVHKQSVIAWWADLPVPLHDLNRTYVRGVGYPTYHHPCAMSLICFRS